MTQKALEVHAHSTPACLKSRLKLIPHGRLQSRACGIVGSVVRLLSGVGNFYNPSMQRRLQRIGAELDVTAGEALACFQGGRWHASNVAQGPSSRTHPEGPKLSKAAKIMEQNRNPFHEVVGGIQFHQQSSDSLKVELEQVGAMKRKLTRHTATNSVLENREPESLPREDEEQSSGTLKKAETANMKQKHLTPEKILRRPHWEDGRSRMKARFDLIDKEGLQFRSDCGSKDWSRNSAQGNASTAMSSVEGNSRAIDALQNFLQRRIMDSHAYIKILQMCSKQKDLSATKQDMLRVVMLNLH